jgi:hypothetical protein
VSAGGRWYSLAMQRWAARGARGGPTGAFSTSDLLIARHDDGAVVLHVPSGTYLKLDASATEILDLVRSNGRAGAASELVAKYGLDPDTATTDVTAVLDGISGTRAPAAPGRRPALAGVATVFREWTGLASWSARLMVVEVAALVVGAEVALRVAPIDAIARRVGAPLADVGVAVDPTMPPLEEESLTDHELLLFAAGDWVLARWVYDATCLRRALVGGWILRRRHPELRIGLVEEGDVAAHAWLVVEGRSIGAQANVSSFSRAGRPDA